jgi:hypothetical protein
MEKLMFVINSLQHRDSYNGFAGLGLMATATMVAQFHIIVGVLMALGGIVLLYFNIMLKWKQYNNEFPKNQANKSDSDEA